MHTGEVIGGRFELRQVLGEGGMGQVFKAWDTDLERFVAIKTLLPQFMSDPAAQAEMKQEVRITQRLSHPGIVAVYDYRVHDRTPFIIMEFVDGQALHQHLFRQPTRRLDERAFMPLADLILGGVAYAHERGVVHRDLKPANIMVLPTGQVKIMDFGIAAAVRATYTRVTGHTSGLTVQYSSPEQINGENPHPSMDIYALGCVFYEMLTGHPPFFQGEIIYQQLTREPAPIPGVSPTINAAVLQCLAKTPQQRLKSAGEVRAALLGERRPSNGRAWWQVTWPPRAGTDPAALAMPSAGLAIAAPQGIRARLAAIGPLPLALTCAGALLLAAVGVGMLTGTTHQAPSVAPPGVPASAAIARQPDLATAVPEPRASEPPATRSPRQPAAAAVRAPEVVDATPDSAAPRLPVDLVAEVRGAFNDGRYRDGTASLELAERNASPAQLRELRRLRRDMVALLLDRAAATLDSAQQQACAAATRLDRAAARHKACLGVSGQDDDLELLELR